MKERLSKLDLELPPSATLHRQKSASDLHIYHLLHCVKCLTTSTQACKLSTAAPELVNQPKLL